MNRNIKLCRTTIQVTVKQTKKQTINKQRNNKEREKEDLCDAPLHPLPLGQVSVLLQNCQQLPQVANLIRLHDGDTDDAKRYHLSIGPQDQKKGRPSRSVNAKVL